MFYLVKHPVDSHCCGELLVELPAPVDQLFKRDAISLSTDAIHHCVEAIDPLCSHLSRVYLAGHTTSYAVLEGPLEVVSELIAIQSLIFVDI